MTFLQSVGWLVALGAWLPASEGWLGVTLADSESVKIAVVHPDSPAERAGLLSGDELLAVDGEITSDVDAFVAALRAREAGDVVRLRIRRGGETREVEVTLAARPGAGEPPMPPAERESDRRVGAASERGSAPAVESAPGARGGPGFAADFDATLAEARRRGQPTLLVFGASWCPSCRALERALADPALAEVLAGYARVWVDTDRQGELADRFRVEEIPCSVVLDARGEPVAELVGFKPAATLLEWLERHGGAAPGSREEAPGPQADPQVEGLRAELRGLRAEISELKQLLRRLARRRGS